MFKPAGSTEVAGELKKQGLAYREPFEKRQLADMQAQLAQCDGPVI
jgi:hypothetical protein